MKLERKAFQPLNTDDLDTKIETLAREKGVGALVKPAKGEQGARPSAEVPAPVTLPEPPAEGATPRARMKPINVEAPDYLWTELKIRAAQRQTSVRHIVLSALAQDGFTIADADMIEDGRRVRGRDRNV